MADEYWQKSFQFLGRLENNTTNVFSTLTYLLKLKWTTKTPLKQAKLMLSWKPPISVFTRLISSWLRDLTWYHWFTFKLIKQKHSRPAIHRLWYITGRFWVFECRRPLLSCYYKRPKHIFINIYPPLQIAFLSYKTSFFKQSKCPKIRTHPCSHCILALILKFTKLISTEC